MCETEISLLEFTFRKKAVRSFLPRLSMAFGGPSVFSRNKKMDFIPVSHFIVNLM